MTTPDLSTPEAIAQARAATAALLDALPGKVDNEVLLDWPCEGQASLLWWDIPHAEVLRRLELHHFEGMDFKVIHDEGEADTPIWKLFAAAPDTARTLLTALDQLAAALIPPAPASGEVEIINPRGRVAYRRPLNHPDVLEALQRPGYSVRKPEATP